MGQTASVHDCLCNSNGYLSFVDFVPPEGQSNTFYFVWLAVLAALVNFFQTLYHIPHLALGAEMSHDYMERTSLFSFGSLFGSVAGYGFYFVMLTFFFPTSPEGINGLYYYADRYSEMAMVCTALIVTSILACAWLTRHIIPFLPKNDPSLLTDQQRRAFDPEKHDDTAHLRTASFRETFETLKSMRLYVPTFGHLFGDLRVAFSSPSYRSIFIGLICSTIVLTIEGVFTPFMGVHFWGLSTEDLRWIGVVVPIGLPIGAMIARPLNRLLDKKMSLILPSIIAILNANVLIVLRLTDIMPANGHPIICHSSFRFVFWRGCNAGDLHHYQFNVC